MASQQVVSIGGRRVTVTNLEKVMYPEDGTTKGDVISYYTAVSATLLPHLRGRPVTRKRWVHGVGTSESPGKAFFQKNLDSSAPDWVERGPIQHRDHVNFYPLVGDVATLTWLAQIGALEIHVPQWRFDTRRDAENIARRLPGNPDRLVLDLDPGEGVGLQECAEVARLTRAILRDVGLEPHPVTSGSKGIHLYCALDGTQTSDQASALARELARALAADHPGLIVSDMKKSIREGRVLLDWSQNSAHKTTVSPYSLRGRSRPFVAAPRTWSELASPDLSQLDYREVLRRLERRDDPLMALGNSAAHTNDRLEIYRSKRNAERTPEPVAAAATSPENDHSAPTFVIQEHHARRLHWDFRLERDGVLVSWALPKGVPTDPHQNHLAVQTEDHPLDYGSFEGLIPPGEYGAGEVRIWDHGTYDLEKWRDGEEIIVTVHGTVNGTARYAIIRTHSRDDPARDNKWLIHLMQPDGAGSSPASPPASLPASPPRSVPDPAKPLSPSGDTGGSRRAPKPMLATAGSAEELALRQDGQDWVYEMKWDGFRALAQVTDRVLRLTSRNGVELTGIYPELAEIATRLSCDATVDGEIVAVSPVGRVEFARLQSRAQLTASADITRAAQTNPVRYVIFDVLDADVPDADTISVVNRPWVERRQILNNIVSTGTYVQLPGVFEGDLDGALEASRRLHLEGIVAKRRTSRYTPGRRSAAWIKVKHHRHQEVVIGGWRPGRGRRQGQIGSLLMGIPEDGGLRYVGRVGTGFTDMTVDSITATLAGIEQPDCPFLDVPPTEASDARWVTPSLVGEVEYGELTAAGRIRQPNWRGWRPDKSPGEVRPEI